MVAWVHILPMDKMAASLDIIFQMHFYEWKFCILIQISLKFVPKGPIDNKAALVQVIASCPSGD